MHFSISVCTSVFSYILSFYIILKGPSLGLVQFSAIQSFFGIIILTKIQSLLVFESVLSDENTFERIINCERRHKLQYLVQNLIT